MFVDLRGVPLTDNRGGLLRATTDTRGRFIMPLPQDTAKAGFLKVLEGFVECTSPTNSTLVVSTYLNTQGLRSGPARQRGDGEQLRGLQVGPATTVSRLMLQHLPSLGTDRVAIQARFLDDIAGLRTQSPVATLVSRSKDALCAGEALQRVVGSVNVVLGQPPLKERGYRAGMAAYVAAQLFLAIHKEQLAGATVADLLPSPQASCATEVVPVLPPAEHFATVLERYFQSRDVTKDQLVLLVTPSDARRGLHTDAQRFACGCNQVFTGRPSLLTHSSSLPADTLHVQNRLRVNFAETASTGSIFAASTLQVRVTDTRRPASPFAGARVVVTDGATTVAQGVTDAQGDVVLEVDMRSTAGKGKPLFTAKTLTVTASKDGVTPQTKTVTVVALATVDVTLALTAP